MKKFSISVVLMLVFIVGASAQESSSLEEALKNAKDLFREVSTKNYTYRQTLKWNQEFPYKLTYIQDRQGKKGTESILFEFSLRDIDLNTIKVEDQKDMMVVNFFIENRQKLIKVFQGDEQQKYINELELVALDADNGRALESFLKEAIPLAREIKSVCAPATFEERLTWLQDNISTFTVNETTFDQHFKTEGKGSSMIEYSLVERGKKTMEEHWKINLTDLDERKVSLEIKDTEVFVEVETKGNLKYIYYEKDGAQGNYTNSVKFMVNDFEKAKCMMSVLEEAIKASAPIDKAKYPEITSLDQALGLLTDHLKDIHSGEDKTSQTLQASCNTEFTVIEQKSKGDPSEEKSKFNLIDIEPKSIEIKVKGKEISVAFDTGKDKLVQPFKNGELQNYTNDVTFLATNTENAKMLAYILPEAVKLCGDQKGFEPAEKAKDNLEWITGKLSDKVESNLEQSIKMIEETDCKWQFTTIEQGKKEDTREVYEFNLIDLDEEAVRFKISGKTLSVEIPSKRGAKNIKYYKNGEPGDYQNSFLIRMQNVEDARNLIRIFQTSIKACKAGQ
ncbi:MAG: hypothetical protein KDC85_01625 [Saprospiraceae bacterium]|nr:hypothetical protein [Saprospiraceae bacterium]MCB9323415.1 hypothetical protein [Lewinellaceae bacterium]